LRNGTGNEEGVYGIKNGASIGVRECSFGKRVKENPKAQSLPFILGKQE
jgi:hypothetical protein